ncbi:ABC transporter G family member 37 [Phytophthora ramorum]|uniref:ABC transporter G family member 37 n=1 Tax=Phytophthora ramorum TaxID=164328 RepID=UPI0030B37FEF|nr:ABC transporter G family member 37 [Phytophthora ramorum]
MATEDKKTEATASLLQPEANDGGEQVPEVYRSLNFRSLQDPYSHNRDTMASRYSTLRADDLDTMLNGGLERFYKKYDHLSRKINLQLPTPEVRFENLSFSVQVPAEVGSHGTTDNHIPTLTVRETFKFADMCVNGRPEDQPEEMREIAALRTELMLQILGLENCADTVVGDALLRGVSGGERKRVTVGEVLVGGQSLFLCDEISTGLDSAATFDIIKALRTWCKTLGGSVMVALLQPTPEVVEHNMLSEFSSDRYTPVESQTLLDSFSITQGTEYVWFGIVVLLAYYFVFTTLNGMALHYIRYEKYKGVSVKPMTAKAEDEDNVYVEVNTPGADGAKGNSGGLPFTPSNLCIKDLEYFVTLPSGEEKQLLRGITAHFEPGRMVALMGATGAGKTTLMDVIAGRKTGGRIVGDIIVNGEKDPANFSRITAYCEQMDIHSEAATIYEALVFSANLRLPPNFTEEERMNLDYSIEYKNSELYKSNRERTLKLAEVSDEFVRHSTLNYDPIATGFTNQLGQLAKKQQLTYWRNPQYNFMRMFLFPLFGIIFGTTFYQLSADSVKRINSHIGLIYNSMDFIGVINLMTVLEVTCAERAVFYRERMSNYYGPLPYSLSLFFAEVPYLVVVIILFVTIEYWLVGWSDNVGNFFFFMFVFYLYTSACTFVGQWMSALMPNEKVANVAVGALSCLFNLFSGYLLPRPAMKAGYKWFTYLMPSSYSLSALVGVQLGEVQDIISVTSGNTTTEMTVAQYVEDTYDFRPDSKYNFMVGLIVIWAVLQVAIYLTFKYVSHLKR